MRCRPSVPIHEPFGAVTVECTRPVANRGAAALLVVVALLAACDDSESTPTAVDADATPLSVPGPIYYGESLLTVADRAGCAIDPDIASRIDSTPAPEAGDEPGSLSANTVECTLAAADGARVSLSVFSAPAPGNSNAGRPPSGIKVFTGRYFASGPGYEAYPIENSRAVAETRRQGTRRLRRTDPAAASRQRRRQRRRRSPRLMTGGTRGYSDFAREGWTRLGSPGIFG